MSLRFPALLRAERIIPLLCIIAAVCLIASEFMIAFELTPPGGEPLAEQSMADRHSYLFAVLGFFAIAATIVTVLTGSRPAAIAVAVTGGMALLLYLILDLPDANSIGAIRDQVNVLPDAQADPQEGFWLQTIGAVFLGLGGGGMAILEPDALKLSGGSNGSLDEDPAEDGADEDDRADRGSAGEIYQR